MGSQSRLEGEAADADETPFAFIGLSGLALGLPSVVFVLSTPSTVNPCGSPVVFLLFRLDSER